VKIRKFLNSRFFIVLFFASFFSGFSFAADFTWASSTGLCPTGSAAATGNCLLQYRNGQTFTGITNLSCTSEGSCSALANFQQDVAGTIYNYEDPLAAVGSCAAGQTFNQGAGICESPSCPEGTVSDQTLDDIIADRPAACRTPSERCQYRKASGAFANINLKTAVENCRTVCSINADGPWPVTCEFTGEPYTPGTGDGSENVQGAPTLQPPPEKTENNNTPCPPNTDAGYVNGQRYCAPRTNSSGQPNISPSVANTNGTVTTSTSTTTTNSNGTVTTTTVTNTVGGGSGNGNGSGEGEGAGECDPTDDDYFQCLQVLEEKPDANAEQGIIDQAGNKVQIQWSDIEQQYRDAIGEGSDFSVDTPDGIGSAITNMLPNGSSGCTSYNWVLAGHSMQLSCDRLSDFKQFLAWAFSLMTIIYIYKLATKPVGD